MARDEAGKKGKGYIMGGFSEFLASHPAVPVSERDKIRSVSQRPTGSLSDKQCKNGEQGTRPESARAGWKILHRSWGQEKAQN